MQPSDELIVIDDGSTDGTEAVMASLADRVRYVKIPHGGAGRARNVGVDEARCPLVAFLDSDDEWTPDKLELQRTVMTERSEVLFSFTDFAGRRQGEADRHHHLSRWHGDERAWDAILGPPFRYSTVGALPLGRPDFDVFVGDLYPEVLSGHFVPTFTLMVRRTSAGDALWFAEDVATYEDLECHARLAQVGLAAYVDCETAYQWGHPGPRLTDADRFACASARLTIVERVYGRDPAFMKCYRERYEHEVRSQHLNRARYLLGQGRSPEARHELRLAGRAPVTYRGLSLAPPWVLAPGTRAARRVVRRARSLRSG
jgi:glycosyltransferase involved in cell wall biosynthesis